MPFFSALTLLITACTAYLLHQFWSRSLSSHAAPPAADGTAAEASDPPSRLKAA